jgi:hypothetical protein
LYSSVIAARQFASARAAQVLPAVEKPDWRPPQRGHTAAWAEVGSLSGNESPAQEALETGAPPLAVLRRGAVLPAALEPKVPLAADEEPVPDADDECSEDQTAARQQQQEQRPGPEHQLA